MAQIRKTQRDWLRMAGFAGLTMLLLLISGARSAPLIGARAELRSTRVAGVALRAPPINSLER